MPTGAKLIVALLMLVGVLCSSSANGQKESPKFININLGPFELGLSYNETKYNDKLRLSKSFVRYTIKHPALAEGEPFISAKNTFLEELVRCDSLILDKPELKLLIDCRPLEALVLDGNLTRSMHSKDKINAVNLYVKRNTYKLKDKTFHQEAETRVYAYPLQANFVDENIVSILAENNQTGQTFEQPADSFGYYLEASRLMKHNAILSASAELFLSVKQQHSNLNDYHILPEVLIGLIDDQSLFEGMKLPDIFERADSIVHQGFHNGYIFSLKDAHLSSPDYPGFGLGSNFTMIKRNEFPYLTCQHTIRAFPLAQLWNYDGSIKQYRQKSAIGGEYPYSTNISIFSASLLEMLQFGLEQSFDHQNENTGNEYMVLLHKFISVVVSGDWSAERFIKSISFFDRNFLNDKILTLREKISKGVGSLFNIIYSDELDNDHVTLSFTMKRDFFTRMSAESESSNNRQEMVEEEVKENESVRYDL